MNRLFKFIATCPFARAILSAVLVRLVFPTFDYALLAWMGLVPLLTGITPGRPWRNFAAGYVAGVVFFITALFWLIHVTIPGMIILSLALALYWAVFAVGCGYAQARLNFFQKLFFIPSLWVILELIRSHVLTGFPWVLLGHSQALIPAAIQGADITGAYGVSFVIILANVFFYELWSARRGLVSRAWARALVPAVILAAWFVYGAVRLAEDPGKSGAMKISLVQGNIPQEIKWAASLRDDIFEKYRLLTQIAALKQSPELIIWPETAFPDYLVAGENDAPLQELARETRTPLLVGSIRLAGMRYFNSAVLFDAAGVPSGVYNKLHLVPFGEFLPGRRRFPWLVKILPIEDFTAGRRYKMFSLVNRAGEQVEIGVLICFEDIFSDLASTFVRRGADVLVNITNDAWFGDTSSPYQHLASSIFRAVENRVYVARAANTGISCVIDDAGRMQEIVADEAGKRTFVTGTQAGWVYRTLRQGLYAKLGDIFAYLCALFVTVVLFVRVRQEYGKKNA